MMNLWASNPQARAGIGASTTPATTSAASRFMAPLYLRDQPAQRP